jgi:hypothetical protein
MLLVVDACLRDSRSLPLIRPQTHVESTNSQANQRVYEVVQVSYAIGVAEPLSIHVDTYNTAKEGTNDKANQTFSS